MTDAHVSDASAEATPGSKSGPAEPLALAVKRVSKSFGATTALVDCSFELRRGEFHSIVGENGSGKSTLVKLLSGIYGPDTGEVWVGSERLSGFASPRAAQRRGIATVFQEVLSIDPRSVLENVWLGMEGVLRAPTSLAERSARVRDVLAELLVRPPDLDQPAESLPLSQRQACCVARALVRDPRVLILDESTSALDAQTCDRLFEAVSRRNSAGMSTIFISHRMDEVRRVADRVTVMRSGRTVASGLNREQSSPSELLRLMTGADHLVGTETRARIAARPAGEPVLRTHALQLRKDAPAIDFELRAGELVGVAGLDGHGQDEFLRALAAGPVTGVDAGTETAISSSWRAARQGVFYVPRERRAEALFGGMSVAENFSLATIEHDVRWGLIARSLSARRLARFREQLGIVFRDPRQPIETLSGGNQQKIILARVLAARPRVLLLNDPTRGVDLGAKRDLYAALGDLVREGVAIVMLSTEIDEHVDLMDRVLVFREHQLFCELAREQVDRGRLMASFFGQPAGTHV